MTDEKKNTIFRAEPFNINGKLGVKAWGEDHDIDRRYLIISNGDGFSAVMVPPESTQYIDQNGYLTPMGGKVPLTFSSIGAAVSVLRKAMTINNDAWMTNEQFDLFTTKCKEAYEHVLKDADHFSRVS